MSNLPPQLLFDILVRLIPKDLIRFLCVSTDWYALIGNQRFIKAQLQRSIQTNCARSILYDNGELGFLLFPFDDDDTIGMEAEKIEFELPLNWPGRSRVCGSSIHGVVLIRNSADGGTLALWNPSIRRLKKVPSPPPFEFEAPPQPYSKSQIHYAFGYDSAHDDYKIVEIRGLYKGMGDFTVLRARVSIFSLRSHSWRSIQDMPCNGSRLQERPVFLNGGLSWVIYKGVDGTGNRILTLDLATEEYSYCPMPASFDEFDPVHMFLVALGDCLCICENPYGRRKVFWIMKESWTLLCSFAGKANNCTSPLAFSKNCERVLAKRNTGELFWVDLEKKIEEEVEIHGLVRYATPTICVGSLCLLEGETRN